METASSDGRAANALHFEDDRLAWIVDAWPDLPDHVRDDLAERVDAWTETR